mgnify:CR=1 FL=1
MRFEIGQAVWTARCQNKERHVECPDCGGTGRLRVTFHDDTTASIGCAYCAPGYGEPTGKVRIWDSSPETVLGLVTGVRMSGGKTEWEIAPNWVFKDEDVFATKEEAEARASASDAAAKLARGRADAAAEDADAGGVNLLCEEEEEEEGIETGEESFEDEHDGVGPPSPLRHHHRQHAAGAAAAAAGAVL